MTEATTVKWLSEAIAQATKSARFYVQGSLPIVDPGLEVEGLGPITLPLKPRMAKPLIACCQIAPYGKGTQTLIDREVRNTYELNPDRFRLSDEWNGAIAEATRTVAGEMGLPPELLEAHLYKLLVYEKGGFFLPHRDSEKLERMIASMIVVLPNQFSGGELIVHHGPNEARFRFEDAAAGKSPCFAAFYADCEHEVHRVQSGRRLCLAYNLVLKPKQAKSSGKVGSPAPVDALAESLKSWIAKYTASPLVFALEHHYTQPGLSLDLLKGGDRQIADLIVPAAEKAGCVVHLSQVERHITQFADEDNYGRNLPTGYQRAKFQRHKIIVGETYEDDLNGNHWADLSGKPQPWGTIQFLNSSIVSVIPLDDWKPTSEEFEGYTGNDGNTLDRWYHRSAIVVWHRDHHFDVIASSGSWTSIPLLNQMTTELKKIPKNQREEARADCIRFAQAIIAAWPRRHFWNPYSKLDKLSPDQDFARSLVDLHDRDLIASFLTKLAGYDQSLRLDELILAASKEFGANAFERELKQLIAERSYVPGREEILIRNVEWLSVFSCDEADIADKSRLAHELCVIAVKMFCEPPAPRPSHETRYRQEKSNQEIMLSHLVKALLATGDNENLSRLLEFVREHPAEFRMAECQVPAIEELIPWAKKRFKTVPAELVSWTSAVRQRLESLTAEEPVPPADWVRPAKVNCNCEFCAKLTAFLADPANRIGRIPAREEMRSHLITMIDRNQCDVTYVVEKGKSPFTLVLTKTTGSFNRACMQFQANLKLLESLASITTGKKKSR